MFELAEEVHDSPKDVQVVGRNSIEVHKERTSQERFLTQNNEDQE